MFVLGDHGMTEDGNHGGATPEETGAALLVWSRSAERLLGTASERRNLPEGSGGGGDHRSHDRSDRRAGAALEGVEGVRVGGGVDGSKSSPSSGRKVAQIDLVPTVSLLLGVPVPFGNLGGIIPELFAGSYDMESGPGRAIGEEERPSSESGDDPRYYERLCDALLVNSVQVRGEGASSHSVDGGLNSRFRWEALGCS